VKTLDTQEKLLQPLDKHKGPSAIHEHNEQRRSNELIRQSNRWTECCGVSDAGTQRLVTRDFDSHAAVESEIQVVRFLAQRTLSQRLQASDFQPTSFFFAGASFPVSTTARQSRLRELSQIPGTLIFYEAPHRLAGRSKMRVKFSVRRRAVVRSES
jgi:16S rRNA (cytidine1402-2'-O)-methyltransferase